LARLFEIDQPVNQSSAKSAYQAVAQALLPMEKPDIFNQAMMELGALICTPKNPDCPKCPTAELCQSNRNQSVNNYPKRLESRAVPTYVVAVGIVQNAQKQILITRRAAKGLLGGLWEFPGGKIQDNETPETACLREIREEVNLKVHIEKNLGTVRHAYTHFKIIASVFLVRPASDEIVLNGPVDYQWVSMDQISQYPLPRATHKMIGLFLSENAHGIVKCGSHE
jgi:A/G-specific adenine glycosylase